MGHLANQSLNVTVVTPEGPSSASLETLASSCPRHPSRALRAVGAELAHPSERPPGAASSPVLLAGSLSSRSHAHRGVAGSGPTGAQGTRTRGPSHGETLRRPRARSFLYVACCHVSRQRTVTRRARVGCRTPPQETQPCEPSACPPSRRWRVGAEGYSHDGPTHPWVATHPQVVIAAPD